VHDVATIADQLPHLASTPEHDRGELDRRGVGRVQTADRLELAPGGARLPDRPAGAFDLTRVVAGPS